MPGSSLGRFLDDVTVFSVTVRIVVVVVPITGFSGWGTFTGGGFGGCDWMMSGLGVVEESRCNLENVDLLFKLKGKIIYLV